MDLSQLGLLYCNDSLKSPTLLKRDLPIWLQYFLYLLTLERDQLDPQIKSVGNLQLLLDKARKNNLDRLALRLNYWLDFMKLPSDSKDRSGLHELWTDYTQRALKTDIRFAAFLLDESAYDHHNSGDYKKCLELSQQVFQLLKGQVPENDAQLLGLRMMMIMYLDLSKGGGKPYELYQSIIDILERENLRTARTEAYFNYAVLLQKDNKLAEAEGFYRKSHDLGVSLKSDYYRGHGLKGLRYTQSLQGAVLGSHRIFHRRHFHLGKDG